MEGAVERETHTSGHRERHWRPRGMWKALAVYTTAAARGARGSGSDVGRSGRSTDLYDREMLPGSVAAKSSFFLDMI